MRDERSAARGRRQRASTGATAQPGTRVAGTRGDIFVVAMTARRREIGRTETPEPVPKMKTFTAAFALLVVALVSVLAVETRTEIVRTTTAAEDSKPNSAAVPDVYAIDAGKIRRELGWVPQEEFAGGIRKTVSWYLDNTGWTASVASGECKQWVTANYQERGAA